MALAGWRLHKALEPWEVSEPPPRIEKANEEEEDRPKGRPKGKPGFGFGWILFFFDVFLF